MSLWDKMPKTPATGVVHRWPAMQAHIPYGTVMRRRRAAISTYSDYQYGMMLAGNAVLSFDIGIPTYTSGWEVDPSGGEDMAI